MNFNNLDTLTFLGGAHKDPGDANVTYNDFLYYVGGLRFVKLLFSILLPTRTIPAKPASTLLLRHLSKAEVVSSAQFHNP